MSDNNLILRNLMIPKTLTFNKHIKLTSMAPLMTINIEFKEQESSLENNTVTGVNKGVHEQSAPSESGLQLSRSSSDTDTLTESTSPPDTVYATSGERLKKTEGIIPVADIQVGQPVNGQLPSNKLAPSPAPGQAPPAPAPASPEAEIAPASPEAEIAPAAAEASPEAEKEAPAQGTTTGGFQWDSDDKSSIKVNISGKPKIIIAEGDIMSYLAPDNLTKIYIRITGFINRDDDSPPTGIYYTVYMYNARKKKWLWDRGHPRLRPYVMDISNYIKFTDLKKEELTKSEAENSAQAAAAEATTATAATATKAAAEAAATEEAPVPPVVAPPPGVAAPEEAAAERAAEEAAEPPPPVVAPVPVPGPAPEPGQAAPAEIEPEQAPAEIAPVEIAPEQAPTAPVPGQVPAPVPVPVPSPAPSVDGRSTTASDNDDNLEDIDKFKLYVKIYAIIYLIIKSRINRKLISNYNNKNSSLANTELLNSIKEIYESEYALNRQFNSLDDFLIPALLEEICKNSDDDFCKSYYKHFLKPKLDNNSRSLDEFTKQLINHINELSEKFSSINEKELVINKIKNLIYNSKKNLTQSEYNNIIKELQSKIKL